MRQARCRILVALLAFTVSSFISPCSAAQQTASSFQDQKPDDKTEKPDKKDKKDKDKKKKKSDENDELNTAVFSDAAANDVLGMIRDGLEGHSPRLLLSAFDRDNMGGYLSFEDQIQSMFDRYEGFRAHFRILQATTEGTKGVVLALFEMEEIPKGGNPPQRKSQQLKFELERGRKGWRVVDYNPRSFFS